MNDVSVVIPTFNGAEFIGDALASVFAQTQLPNEVLVVDDCSSDNTCEIVEQIAADSPIPVRIVQMTENSGGPARPINAGINETAAECVALLEQDDIMAPRRIELQKAALAAFPQVGLVIGRPAFLDAGPDGAFQWRDEIPVCKAIWDEFTPAADEAFLVPSHLGFRQLLDRNFIWSNSNVMLRKSLWQRVGGFDPRWRINADADFEFKMLIEAPVTIVNSVVCGYRVRAESLCHASKDESRRDGQLIRLKYALQRPEWAGEDLWKVYWRLRWIASEEWSNGRYGSAARITATLLRSGMVLRHVCRRMGIIRAADSQRIAPVS